MTTGDVLAAQDAIADARTAVRRITQTMSRLHGRKCECTVCYHLGTALNAMTDADHEAAGLDDDAEPDE